MKVVFLQNVANVARKNEIKEVSDGYAYNFLFPRKLAASATADLIKKAQEAQANEVKKLEELKANAQEIARNLETKKITFKVKVSKTGNLYGGITEKDIADYLEANEKIAINKKNIKLEKHIKALGEHKVEIKLTDDISAKIKIIVEAKKS